MNDEARADGAACEATVAGLKAQIAQFVRVCNNLSTAIAYYERSSNACRYANRGYAEMFGQTEVSIIGLTLAQIIGDEAAAAIEPQVEQVRRQRLGARHEHQLFDAQGTPRHIEVHLLPHMPQEGDEPLGGFMLISDISRHRNVESALRESEERLAKFMHASAEGIVFHKGGLITDANPPLLALLGRTLPELLGRHTLEFVAPEQRHRVAEVMASGDEISYDSAILHRDGHADRGRHRDGRALHLQRRTDGGQQFGRHRLHRGRGRVASQQQHELVATETCDEIGTAQLRDVAQHPGSALGTQRGADAFGHRLQQHVADRMT